jgi:flagellar basal-body rod protein FlgF/flagellar basal-body rod protein FlgG
MDSGIYAAYTGLLARTQALDTASNNLANAGTAGFRAQRDYFSAVIAGGVDQNPETASQVGQSVNGFGVLGGNRLDFGQGELKATGNPLDLGLEGQGFFAVQSPQGIRYTRDGAFQRSSGGVLQTSEGESVLDINQKTITIPTGSVYVSPDGSVSVATTAGNVIVAKVGVFDFLDKSALAAEGSNRFSANSATPNAATASIAQGSIEGANENEVQGTMQLVLVQRQAEMMQKALNVFNNDFDKTATEDLPRV